MFYGKHGHIFLPSNLLFFPFC